MNSLINDSSEKTLSLRPFTQPHRILLAFAIDLSQATSMQFTVLTRDRQTARVCFNRIISSSVVDVLSILLDHWWLVSQLVKLQSIHSVTLIQSSQPPVHSVYKFRFQRLDNEFSDIPQFTALSSFCYPSVYFVLSLPKQIHF